MKRNKKLQEYANQSLKTLNNDEFLNVLKERIEIKKTEHHKRKQLRNPVLIGSVAIIVVVVTFLCVFLIGSPDIEDPNKKQYLQANQESSESTIIDLNFATDNLDLVIDLEFSVSKIIDSKYDEILYYSICYSNEETLDTVQLYVVVNKEYDFIFDHAEYDKENDISGQKLNYIESCSFEDEIYYFSAYGEIITQSEKIYIEYNGVSFEENSNFILIINQLLTKSR